MSIVVVQHLSSLARPMTFLVDHPRLTDGRVRFKPRHRSQGMAVVMVVVPYMASIIVFRLNVSKRG